MFRGNIEMCWCMYFSVLKESNSCKCVLGAGVLVLFTYSPVEGGLN